VIFEKRDIGTGKYPPGAPVERVEDEEVSPRIIVHRW